MAAKVDKPKIEKAYSVRKGRPLRRKEATSPLSAEWRLYDPEQFIETLMGYVELQKGATKEDILRSLEVNGYSKATRQREELIKWKVRLQNELKEHAIAKRKLMRQISDHNNRMKAVALSLEGVRNVLRIPREDNPGLPSKK